MERIEYGLGAKLSGYNPNTYPASAVIPKLERPNKLRHPELGVANQRWVGRCVAESVCAILSLFIYQQTGVNVKLNVNAFYQYRKEGQYKGQGMMASDAADNSRNFGVPLHEVLADEYMEYDASYMLKITEAIMQNAALHKSITTCRIQNTSELINAIAAPDTGCFIVHPVYESFMYGYHGGLLPMPNEATEKNYGLHAEAIWGFDTTRTQFDQDIIIPRNSWSDSWGDKGYSNMPVNYPIAEMWALTAFQPIYDTLEVFLNSKTRLYNGEATQLDVEPFIKEGRLFTPSRFTHDLFGDIVEPTKDAEGNIVSVKFMRARIPKA